MIPELRKEFNERFTPHRYETFLRRLDHRCRTNIAFRVCETPMFVPAAIGRECEEAAIDLTLQLHRPDYLELSDATLRPEYTVAGQPDRSLFMTVDFAMTPGPDDTIVPKLIELQGFPSLMGFQLAFAETAMEHYGLPPELSYINGGHARAEYVDLLRRAIVADHDPENVVLLEHDPWHQKTVPDFHIIHELLGIEVVDVRYVVKSGRTLEYEKEGRRVPIRRIFNRTIVDELERARVEIPFNWHDELDLEWAGHPNWYFRISKFALPFLNHPTVPKSIFLNRLTDVPGNLEEYVLKPLYSFAGSGVIVGPTEEDLRNVPPERRGEYVLQERIEYAGAVHTPAGATKAELRIMLIWLPDEDRPRPVMSLVRMGRGKMMGVDYNRNMEWIGAGCNFYAP